MRRRYIIVISSFLVAALVIGIWLVLRETNGQAGISIGYTTARGHFPEPGRIYADRIFVVWVTNTGRMAIWLRDPKFQYQIADGRVVTDMGSSWNLMSYGTTLSPGGVTWLPTGLETYQQKLKFDFDYDHEGSALLKAISAIVGRLPWKRLSRQNQLWLRNHGMIDGFVHVHYESGWITNDFAQRTQ